MKKKYTLFIFSVLISYNSIAQIALLGMTQGGGTYGAGSIFITDTSGQGYSVMQNFYRTDGIQPLNTKLVEASDGKLYGMTSYGGSHGRGVIFQYDPVTNVYIKKFDFDGVNYGSSPRGSLILATDGKLYGMNWSGGASNFGVLFQYDPISNSCIKKIDFDGSINGSRPEGSLMQASDGKLYGMTGLGGANNKGVLFQYDPLLNSYVKMLDFNGTTNGANPKGELIQATDGKLYGMTSTGGTYNEGTLFHYDPVTGVYTKKRDFANTGNGGYSPQGGLIQASDGNLYGMTLLGGINNKGVLFQYVPSTGMYTKKWDFTVGFTYDGAQPFGSLIQASDGNLYGLTYSGGSAGGNVGIIFRYNPSTSNYSITINGFGGGAGEKPHGSLMQASDGKLYGMTYAGGINDTGVLFQYDFVTNTYVKKIDLGGANPDGCSPTGALMLASNGKIYGMTKLGGISNQGVLFEYDPFVNIYSKKFDFWYDNGILPNSSLMQASDGKLYGMTYSGGTGSGGDKGVIFQYDPVTSIYTKKLDFNGTNGANPWGELMQASDGKLYGMTNYGGINNTGVLFQYDPITSVYTKKIDFPTATVNGVRPIGSLIQATDGKLYGMTPQGGVNNKGVIFQFDPVSGIYTKKMDFDGLNNGSSPQGSLIQAIDGKLYGTAYAGGTNNFGVLFQYDYVTNTYTKKLDFNGVNNGNAPQGNLMQASDGKIYGTTSVGGNGINQGVIFQYDPVTSVFRKIHDFDGTGGMFPQRNTLVEISLPIATSVTELKSDLLSVFPNPVNNELNIRKNHSVTSELCIKIIDVVGKEVLIDYMKEEQTKTLMLDKLTSGLYFIEIENGKTKTVKKFIKE